MNPNDMLYLTIPASLAALKFGLITFAVVMLARSIFHPQGKLSTHPIKPPQAPKGWRIDRA
jgi:hypothetical protein